MTGREKILERIRQNKPEGKTSPGSFKVNCKTHSKGELLIWFKESLKKAGAEIKECASKVELEKHIKNKLSDAINMAGEQTKVQYQHGKVSKSELEKTKFLIVEAQFGVAENGAIWIDELNFSNRLLPFITQQLVLILDKAQLVSTMHEAYQKNELAQIGFGVFISGPSKTADIEQNLVYGAHGAKELEVVLC